MSTPLSCSAVIPTRNRPDDILACLQTMRVQTVPVKQIIIVDSSDTPLNASAAFSLLFTEENFPDIELIYHHTATRGAGPQRNIGADLASGDLVCLCDDDVLWAPDYVAQTQKVFAEHPAYGGGMGDTTNERDEPWYTNWYYRFFRMHGQVQKGSFTASGMWTMPYRMPEFASIECMNGCATYRREVLQKYRFDEKLWRRPGLEDVDLSKRVIAEYPLFYSPAIKMIHLPSAAARETKKETYMRLMRHHTYIFFKNFYPESRWRIFAFVWTVLGFLLHAVLKRSWTAFSGYLQGLYRYARHGVGPTQ